MPNIPHPHTNNTQENDKEMNALEDRLVKVETSLAYIEDFLVKIQDEAVKQWKEIERLQKENVALKNKLNELENADEMPHERPPHY